VDALAQQQARMTLGFVIATSFAAIAAVALWMWRDARAQRRLADRSQAQLSLQASAMQSALGNAGAAVALALQALRTARRARLQHHVAAALECLGDIRRGQGRADKGVEHWQRSRRGFEACGRLADAARVAGKLAEAQEALGERAQAAASRRRAHELAAQAQAQPTMQRVQQLAAELDIDEDRRRAAEAAFHTGKMAAIGRMVAAVSHELKRPLASLRLLAELSGTLLQRGDTTRVQHNLGQIVNLADRLAELTRTLEDFSRKQPYQPVPVRLRDSVGEALRILAPQLAGEDRIALGGTDAWVQADAGRLRLVLVNLLSNAIEATAASADRRIEIRIRRDGAQAVLAVRDHGPGLSAEAQAHLFELFASTKPSGQGLGMGLALSAKVAREMGGELAGRNHPEGGAEFTLRLRLAVPAGETLQK
jgi:C4-dicarboxylate-specific signal transduction histidine kinase